ncbi:hypothetical protein [Thiocystis violascens]|uniref:Uncharacterized protein n=1 Tax=Thiocystis violascens (strain ATCC 17096 / DSM 198 / 6111) TaxID=765911 RepID=I3Y831_THIV6|nr:hypothetical protein [Thiocystis violascens]AFL73149.1 hypothetical protein Thivi_1119 [Thiocystis violascens DSM 198]
MSALELGSLILAVEFALVAWAILFLLLRRQRQRLESDHAHANTAVAQIETTDVSRRAALTSLFESSYRMPSDELAAKVDEYVAREQAFYKVMLSLYLERDGARLKDIPEELTKVLTPWANLKPHGMVPADDLDQLESEKAQLSAELDTTKHTLDELMNEYAAAFSRTPRASKLAEPSPPPQAPPPTEFSDDAWADSADEDTLFAETPSMTERSEPDIPPEEPDDPSEFEIAVNPLDPMEQEAARLKSSQLFGDDTPDDDSEEELARQELDGLAGLFSDQSPSESDDEEARAREELEGLADLFETPPSKPRRE